MRVIYRYGTQREVEEYAEFLSAMLTKTTCVSGVEIDVLNERCSEWERGRPVGWMDGDMPFLFFIAISGRTALPPSGRCTSTFPETSTIFLVDLASPHRGAIQFVHPVTPAPFIKVANGPRDKSWVFKLLHGKHHLG